MFDTTAPAPDMWECPKCNTRYEKEQLIKKAGKNKIKKGDKVMAKKAECIICGKVKTIIGRGRCGGCYARGKKMKWNEAAEKQYLQDKPKKNSWIKYPKKMLKTKRFMENIASTGKYIIVSRDTPELTAAELLDEVMLGHANNMKVLKTQ